jgi:hypothetical protein
MKNKIKYAIVAVTLIVCFNLILNKIVLSITPPFISKSINDLKSNKSLITKIGGYKEFKFQFDDDSFKREDTTHFEIQILGYEKGVIFKGKAVKIAKDWKIIQSDTSLKEYE